VTPVLPILISAEDAAPAFVQFSALFDALDSAENDNPSSFRDCLSQANLTDSQPVVSAPRAGSLATSVIAALQVIGDQAKSGEDEPDDASPDVDSNPERQTAPNILQALIAAPPTPISVIAPAGASNLSRSEPVSTSAGAAPDQSEAAQVASVSAPKSVVEPAKDSLDLHSVVAVNNPPEGTQHSPSAQERPQVDIWSLRLSPAAGRSSRSHAAQPLLMTPSLVQRIQASPARAMPDTAAAGESTTSKPADQQVPKSAAVEIESKVTIESAKLGLQATAQRESVRDNPEVELPTSKTQTAKPTSFTPVRQPVNGTESSTSQAIVNEDNHLSRKALEKVVIPDAAPSEKVTSSAPTEPSKDQPVQAAHRRSEESVTSRAAEPSLPVSTPETRPRRLADLSFRIETSDQTPVVLRVREKAQAVEITLRANDSRWAAPLEKEIPTLIKSLERTGWSAEPSTPSALSEAKAERSHIHEVHRDNLPDRRGGEDSRQGGSSDSSQRQPDQQQGRKNRQFGRNLFSLNTEFQKNISPELIPAEVAQ